MVHGTSGVACLMYPLVNSEMVLGKIKLIPGDQGRGNS